MNVTAIGTLKGGAGKTTVLFNLAGILAESKRVLLIDLDPQCNLSGAAGIDIAVKSRASSRDIFDAQKEASPEELVVRSPIGELPNLDIIPSHMLMTAVEFSMVNRSAREWILSNFIEDHRTFFEQYDYVLLDTNPSMGIVNQNAFAAADNIILVTDISKDGIMGTELFSYLWEGVRRDLRKPDNIRALVINSADRRINLTKELYEYCQDDEDLIKLLVENMIYSKVVYKDARMAHKPVNLLKNGKEAAEDIRGVIASLYERGVF